MEPNEGKEYSHQFMPQMPYSGDFANYIPEGYHTMPTQSIPGIPMGTIPQMRGPYLNQPQPQVQYQAAPTQNSSQAKVKGKRRSKNETEGRNYKCTQCERTYLSYPALYTHIKTKHSVQGEAPMTSGRGRGRPKKSLAKEEHIDPTSMLYFRATEYKGGPTNVLYKFKEAYETVNKNNKSSNGYENHKLYIELYKRHSKNVSTLNYAHEHPDCTDFGPTPTGMATAVYVLKAEEPPKPPEDGSEPKDNPNSESITPEKKQRKCDEVFAEYLDTVAKEVNKECYANVLKFVFLFRECLNHYGDKPGKSKDGEEEVNVKDRKEEYCAVNNPEQAPEVSNEFVTMYLDEIKTSFGNMDPIDLTQNFCGWLFSNGYTCSKLSLIQDNP